MNVLDSVSYFIFWDIVSVVQFMITRTLIQLVMATITAVDLSFRQEMSLIVKKHSHNCLHINKTVCQTTDHPEIHITMYFQFTLRCLFLFLL